LTLVSAGRVGKPHGLDGSFYVERASHELPEGIEVLVGRSAHRVERRAGTDARPLVRLAGVSEPRAIRGETLLVDVQLVQGEFLAADLLACTVVGMGPVKRVVDGPSCSVLELADGTLVPLVSDAVLSIDLAAGEIHVDRAFLG
jgi:16S rRNA processing protein RimM